MSYLLTNQQKRNMNNLLKKVSWRSLSLLLFATGISAMPSWAQSFTDGGVKYTIDDYKKEPIAVVVGADDKQLTTLNIPARVSYDGKSYPVVTIAKDAFAGNTSLSSVTLPEELESIQRNAFDHCSALTSIALPASLKTIEKYAFQHCGALSQLSLPSGLTMIEEGAFSGCQSLTSIELPEDLTTLGKYAFDGCTSLTTIVAKSMVAPNLDLRASFPNSEATLEVPYGATAYDQGEWATFNQRTAKLVISDKAQSLNAPREEANVNVEYVRTFGTTLWQPLFVPFDIAVSDLGDKFELALLKPTQSTDSVRFRRLVAGDVLLGNSIALIRAKQTGEHTIALPSTTVRVSQETVTKIGDYTFTGAYQKTTGHDLPGRWVMSGGKFRTALPTLQLSAFRWYLDVPPSATAQSLRFGISEDNSVTNIERVTTQGAGATEVYDLSGRRLGADSPRGTLRIVNGHKTFSY